MAKNGDPFIAVERLMADQSKLESKFQAHRHCVYCGKAFSPSSPAQATCSPECENAIRVAKKKERRYALLPLILVLLTFFFIFVLPMILGR